jgi:hypothetical protein
MTPGMKNPLIITKAGWSGYSGQPVWGRPGSTFNAFL